MASGHANRANRPNTWLHRPATRREVLTCQPGAVHTWHKADSLQKNREPDCWAGLSFKGPEYRHQGLLGARNSYLISPYRVVRDVHRNEPAGSPAEIDTVTQANGSVPVIPLYLPVPPVMI